MARGTVKAAAGEFPRVRRLSDHRSGIGLKTRHFPWAAGAAFAGGTLIAGCSGHSAGVPRNPPRPFTVHASAVPVDDGEDASLLAEALEAVHEQLEGRRRWFALADSPAEADLVLRIVRYTLDRSRPGLYAGASETIRIHMVDAVAVIGDRPHGLSGFDHREVEFSRLQYAASALVDELERLCRENYAVLIGAAKPQPELQSPDGGGNPLRGNAHLRLSSGSSGGSGNREPLPSPR